MLLQPPSPTSSAHSCEDKSPSPASSAHPCEDEPPPLGASHAIRMSSDSPAIASPLRPRREENTNTATSSRGILMLKSWLPTRIGNRNKGPELREPDRVPKKLSRPTEHQSRSRSPAKVEATNEGSSWMAAARPKRVSASLNNIRSDMGCLIYHPSEWLRRLSDRQSPRFVVPRLCLQELIRRCSENRVPSPPDQI